MPWGAVVGAAATLYGAKKQGDAAKKASKGAELQPFDINSILGNANIRPAAGGGPGTINVENAPGSALVPGFEQAAAGILPMLQGAPAGLLSGIDPNVALALGLNSGAGVRQPLVNAGTGLALQGSQLARSLEGFDSDAFASEQFQRLNRLAAPGEETAAARTANNLFSRGRLGSGDSVSGQVFRDLDLSQSLARDNRLLQALGLAQSERANIADTAGSLIGSGAQTAGLGEQLAQSELGRLLGSIQAGTGVGTFQAGLRESLLGQALNATGGISSAIAPTQQQINNLLSSSGLATGASGAASALQLQGANAQLNTLGQLGGSLLGATDFSNFNWGFGGGGTGGTTKKGGGFKN